MQSQKDYNYKKYINFQKMKGIYNKDSYDFVLKNFDNLKFNKTLRIFCKNLNCLKELGIKDVGELINKIYLIRSPNFERKV